MKVKNSKKIILTVNTTCDPCCELLPKSMRYILSLPKLMPQDLAAALMLYMCEYRGTLKVLIFFDPSVIPN